MQLLNALFDSHALQCLDNRIEFLDSYFRGIVFTEKLRAQTANRLDAAAGADAEIYLFVAEFLFQALVDRMHVSIDQLIGPLFPQPLLIQNLQQPHAAHRIAVSRQNSLLRGQTDFNTPAADIDQQSPPVLETALLLQRKMDKPRLFLGSDNIDLNAIFVGDTFRKCAAIARFPDGTGGCSLDRAHAIPVDLFAELPECFQHLLDGRLGTLPVRKYVLTQPYSFARVMDDLIMAIGVQRRYSQAERITPNVDCSGDRHSRQV